MSGELAADGVGWEGYPRTCWQTCDAPPAAYLLVEDEMVGACQEHLGNLVGYQLCLRGIFPSR